MKRNAADKIPDGNDTADSIFAGTSGNGVYTWTKGDYSGGNQPIKYFRGNVNNNWVVFGKDGSAYIWWRIIRNNSNGSLRMIYAGTSASKTVVPATTGTGTKIGTSVFNTNYENNAYVGFKYTSNQVHGIETASTILGLEDSKDKTTLYGWYNSVLKVNYGSYIDIDAGFCNDRTFTSGTGLGTSVTNYAAYNRLGIKKIPSLLCADADDIFKTPIGLITADELNMGGMLYEKANVNSYLYTNTIYLTMTPYGYQNNYKAQVFYVHSDGYFYWRYVWGNYGVRPVVNLKADVKFVS